MEDRLLDLQQAANVLGMSTSWLAKKIRQKGAGVPVHYLGTKPRFIYAELIDWVRGGEK